MASKLQHHLAAVRRYNATGVWLKFGNSRGDFDLCVPETAPVRPSASYPAPCIVREGRFLLKLVSSSSYSFLPVHPDTKNVVTVAGLQDARVGEPLPYIGPNDVLLGEVSFDLLTA